MCVPLYGKDILLSKESTSQHCVYFACFVYILLYLLCVYGLPTEIDNDGVIEPDTDTPQEMGDFENLEVKCCSKSCSLLCRKHQLVEDIL